MSKVMIVKKPKEVKVGDIFGELKVIAPIEGHTYPDGSKKIMWNCRCNACGRYDEISQYDLLKRKRTKCHNCTNTNGLKDLTGQRFGRLIVLRRAEDHIPEHGEDYNPINKDGKKKKSSKKTMWVCRCIKEGNIVTVRGDALKSGKTLSCGCLQKEAASTQDGLSHTSLLYKKHRSMLARCGYVAGASEKQLKRYYYRGIRICDEWANKETGFMNFYTWAIANGYDEEEQQKKPKEERLSIDRIDNNGNYCPENCRWSLPVTQANNKENTIRITYNGETHSIAEWSRIYKGKISLSTIYDRYHNGLTPEQIFEVPPKSYVKKIKINGKMCTIEQCSYISGINKFLIYDRLKRKWNEHDAIFTPTYGGGINGVYFVNDAGYPVAPPKVIEEKHFVAGVEFITAENELEAYKQKLNAKIEEELRRM